MELQNNKCVIKNNNNILCEASLKFKIFSELVQFDSIEVIDSETFYFD